MTLPPYGGVNPSRQENGTEGRMYSCPPGVNEALPEEYRRIAEALFPPEGYPLGAGPSFESIASFADILGIGKDYLSMQESAKTGAELRPWLGHFQNNLDLLIQKTWVEKADETRKEKLINRLPGLVADIEKEDYEHALGSFGTILEELAYLFFGPQSAKDDFTEYVLRIDPQIGLFWWYGGQISKLQHPGGYKPPNEDAARKEQQCFKAVLLIGLCYLTNF
jgi:hypothetical protein